MRIRHSDDRNMNENFQFQFQGNDLFLDTILTWS